MKARLTVRKAGLWAPALALTTLLGLAACQQKPPASERPPTPGDKAVATVDGATVWASDVRREAAAQGLIGPGEGLDVASQTFRQVLDEVVDQKLLSGEAVRRGLDKDPAVARRLAAARERVLDDVLLDQAVGKVVSESAVQGLYQEMVRDAAPTEQIRLRQIVLATPADAAQVRKLVASGTAFEALAAERSRDEASRFKGGELPVTAVDMLPQAYAEAVKGLGAGALTAPFHTDAGWVVARVDERRQEPPIALAVARPQIIRFLTYDQVKDMILDLRRRAQVRVLIAPPLAPPGAAGEPASAPGGPAPKS